MWYHLLTLENQPPKPPHKTAMPPTKSTTLKLRIHPDKKAALDAVAKNQQLDTSKLLMAQIEKLLAQEPLKENPEGAGQGAATPVSYTHLTLPTILRV